MASSPFMRSKTATPSCDTDQVIVGQGSVPLKKQVDVGIPVAPKGRQTSRFSKIMLRAKTFSVS